MRERELEKLKQETNILMNQKATPVAFKSKEVAAASCFLSPHPHVHPLEVSALQLETRPNFSGVTGKKASLAMQGSNQGVFLS